MSDKNSRLSLFFQDFSNVITYVQPCLVIKCGEWFVEKQKIRFSCKGADQCRPLPHAAGKLAWTTVTEFVQLIKL